MKHVDGWEREQTEMAKNDFLPRTGADRVQWLASFVARLPAVQVLLGLSPADIASAQADLAAFEYAFQVNYLLKRMSIAHTTQLREMSDGSFSYTVKPFLAIAPFPPAPAAVPAGVFARIRRLVRRMKTHPNYNTSVGEGLGIEGPEIPKRPTGSPRGKARADANAVRIDCVKHVAPAVLIETRRNNEDDWQQLVVAFRFPYFDRRPMREPGVPEAREYRLTFVVGDGPYGEASPVMVVALAG